MLKDHPHTVTDEFVLFWGGPFSQWYDCQFRVDGVVYNCTEQYMMAQKALYFGDGDIHNKIMATSSPREQKALGKKVRNFDVEMWRDVCEDIVYTGNYAKFTQSTYLEKVLLDTEDRTIVEASPYDKIWGIGLRETDPKAQDPKCWKGLNLLGIAIMNVRESITLSKGSNG